MYFYVKNKILLLFQFMYCICVKFIEKGETNIAILFKISIILEEIKKVSCVGWYTNRYIKRRFTPTF